MSGRPRKYAMSEIETGISVPEQTYQAAYPWRTIKVGQSFQVFCPSVEVIRLWNSLSSCRVNAQRKTGRKFAMRQTPKGIRVWRTA
jgi:hypothetical protein